MPANKVSPEVLVGRWAAEGQKVAPEEPGSTQNTFPTVKDNDTIYKEYIDKVSQFDEPLEYQQSYFSGATTVYGQTRDISRPVYQLKDLDLNFEYKGKKNIDRMLKGKSPYWSDGSIVELHHILQLEPGAMAEIPQKLHKQYRELLHGLIENGESFRRTNELRNQYKNFRRAYWIARAEASMK